MSAAMCKQTHFEVRRYHGRAQVQSVMRANEPHKKQLRRVRLHRRITLAVAAIALLSAVFLTFNPL